MTGHDPPLSSCHSAQHSDFLDTESHKTSQFMCFGDNGNTKKAHVLPGHFFCPLTLNNEQKFSSVGRRKLLTEGKRACFLPAIQVSLSVWRKRRREDYPAEAGWIRRVNFCERGGKWKLTSYKHIYLLKLFPHGMSDTIGLKSLQMKPVLKCLSQVLICKRILRFQLSVS